MAEQLNHQIHVVKMTDFWSCACCCYFCFDDFLIVISARKQQELQQLLLDELVQAINSGNDKEKLVVIRDLIDAGKLKAEGERFYV